MAALAAVKHEWRQFKRDEPGERFANHRRRMNTRPTWQKIVRGVVGFALIAVGIVFCILPGPGSIGIVLGLALVAGMSKTVARVLDRIEPRMRSGLRRAKAFWRQLSTPKRVALVGAIALVVAVGVAILWRTWLGPKVAAYLA